MTPSFEASSHTPSERCFFLDGENPPLDDEQFVSQLEELVEVGRSQPEQERILYYDTFDWRLYRAGILLSVTTDRQPVWSWRTLDGELRHQARSSSLPGRTDELPPGPFEQLAAHVSIRRLLPLAEIDRRRLPLRVLDDEAKTVARLWVERASVVGAGPKGRSLRPMVRLRSIRGYDAAFRRLADTLSETLGLEPCKGDELTRVASAVGRRPGDYSSKPALPLDPAMSAEGATRSVLIALLDAIERNEEGTRRDLDSEFLHDFRVAVRRTRSVLSQVKGVFDPQELARFRAELKWLGGVTGPTRDLDVYLLKFGDYQAALPEAVRQDLAPLHDYLGSAQRREQQRLARALGSERYRDLLAGWRSFLEQDCQGEREGAPNAERPAIEVVSARIWKIYRRILKRGKKAIEHDSPAEELHDLRIECKKLRYLLELFRSLYPPVIDHSVKILKRLQDNLGDFNDYEVQRDELQSFAEALYARGEVPVGTFLAMGRLQARLEEGQERERRRFARRFLKFAAPGHQEEFENLFAGG